MKAENLRICPLCGRHFNINNRKDYSHLCLVCEPDSVQVECETPLQTLKKVDNYNKKNRALNVVRGSI